MIIYMMLSFEDDKILFHLYEIRDVLLVDAHDDLHVAGAGIRSIDGEVARATDLRGLEGQVEFALRRIRSTFHRVL